jgi:trehalose 6-phosphate phosphatase
MEDRHPASEENAGGVALFLDFDGTLVEIAPTPDEVVVSPELPGLLGELRSRLGGALAIVTGRPISGVDRFLPGLDLDACGLHGLERRIGGHLFPPQDLPDLRPAVARLRTRLARYPGVVIEDKGIGVAVHWRTAPDAETEARAAIDELARELGPTHKIQDGKAVREILPATAGKGDAIRALMRVPPFAGRHPVFVGDDRTDEHGFAAVNQLGGLSIKIGPGDTAAQTRIASVEALRAALRRWLSGDLALPLLSSPS